MIVKMYKDKEVNNNVKNILFINVWRKIAFDICLTGLGTALTTMLPILFQYCYKYCYSTSLSLYIFTMWKCIAYHRLCRDGIYFDNILVSEYKLFKRSNKNLFCSSIVINTVIVTAGTFEPKWKREVWCFNIWFNPPFL
jgi:hypothetical protein